MTPGGVDTSPTYGWSVAIQPECTPVPAGVSQGTTDGGFWNFAPGPVLFHSQMDQGDYAPTLEEKPGSAPAISISYLGRSYQFVLIQPYGAATGVVYVKFVDQVGQPITGVVLRFALPNGREAGGQTPESGEYGSQGVVGVWTISFVPPPGYTVPAPQANPFTSLVGENSVQHLQVSLVKT